MDGGSVDDIHLIRELWVAGNIFAHVLEVHLIQRRLEWFKFRERCLWKSDQCFGFRVCGHVGVERGGVDGAVIPEGEHIEEHNHGPREDSAC